MLKNKKLPFGWKNVKLGDILKVKHGKNQKRVEVKNGKYPILGTGGVIGRTNQYIYDRPSVLIGRKGTIDSPIYMDSPFWTIDTLFYTDINEKIVDAKFLYYLFLNINWYKYNEATGVPSLSAKTIHNIKINLPPIDQQQKIASILSTWDEAIKKREKYLRALKDRKYSLMFKLIKDRNVGQVREYRLEEVASRRKGKPVEIHEDGKYPILTIDSLTKMEFDDYTNDNFVLATEKDILLLWDGSNAGSIFTDVQGAVGSTFMRLRPNEELVNSIYIREYIRLDEEYIKSIREGSGIPHIPRDFLTYYKLKLPSLEKQNEVADILELADKEISLVEEYIVYLQEQKRGLMQLLLTGKVRV